VHSHPTLTLQYGVLPLHLLLSLPMTSLVPTHTHWMVRVVSDTNALASSYVVFLFLGHVPASTSEWRTSSSLVGRYSAFADPSERKESLTQKLVDVNEALRGKGCTLSDHRSVISYVQENLYWRIQKVCKLSK
jgi:hypothetical protein